MNKYDIDFPLCLNKSAERKIRGYIAESCDFMFEHYSNNKIKAIILIGSFSKGEGSVCFDKNGALISFSDIEFLTVLHDEKEIAYFRKKSVSLNKGISARLKNEGLEIEVDFGPYSEKLFKSMTPRMFTLDIKSYGKVIWGNRDILNKIPPLDIREIPEIDAITLLFNRIIEQLMVLDILESDDIFDLEKAIYKIGKTYLDIAASLMAFCKQYKTSYSERCRHYKPFWDSLDSDLLKSKLKDFPEKVDFWTRFRSSPFSGKFKELDFLNIELAKKEILNLYCELIYSVLVIFIWEINNYLKCDWSDNKNFLIERFLAKCNIFQRFKSGIKILRHPFFVKDFSSVLKIKKLIRYGSPKDIIYLSGAMLYFSLPDILNGRTREGYSFSDWEDKLPVIFKDDMEKDAPWQGYRKNLIKNWEIFLKSDW